MKEKFLLFYGWLTETKLVRYFVAPLCLATPPTILTLLSYKDKGFLPNEIQQLIGILSFKKWLIVVLVCWGGILGLLKIVHDQIMDAVRRRREPEAPTLALMLAIFDDVVGRKMQRFADMASKLHLVDGSGDKYGTVFKQITQPRDQIEALVAGVYMLFRQLPIPDSNLKVTLAIMDGDKFSQYLFFLPSDAQPADPKKLRKRSGFCSAVSAAKMIIIQDIKAELRKKEDARRFVSLNGQQDEGSMICYPIMHGEKNTFPYVLSIKSSKKMYFVEAERRRYETMLSRFAKRIAMEHSLLLIRGDG